MHVGPMRRSELRLEVVTGGERQDLDALLHPWAAPPAAPDVGGSQGDAQWAELVAQGRVAVGAAAAEGAVAVEEEPDEAVEAAAAAERHDHEEQAEEAEEEAAEEEAARPTGGLEPGPAEQARAEPAAAAGGRALLFTTTVEECRRLYKYVAATTSDDVVVEHYYAELPESVKSDILRRWLSGDIHIIVATIAFGMGIDVPDVVCVVAWGFPFGGVTELQQLWGRGARGRGREARAVLFVHSLRVPPSLPQPSEPLRLRVEWERGWMQQLAAYVAGGGDGWDVLELFAGAAEGRASWLDAQLSAVRPAAAEAEACTALLLAALTVFDAASAAGDAATVSAWARAVGLLAHAGQRGGPVYEWAPPGAAYRGAIPLQLGLCGVEAEHAAESLLMLLALAGYLQRARPAWLDIAAEAAARERERAAGGSGGSGTGGGAAGASGTTSVARAGAPPSPTHTGLTQAGRAVLQLELEALHDGLVSALVQQTQHSGPLGAARCSRWLIDTARDAAARLASAPPPPPDMELAALLGDVQAWDVTLPAGSDARLLTAAVFPEIEAALSSSDAASLAALRAVSSEAGLACAAELREHFVQAEVAECAALRALEPSVGHPFGPDEEAAKAEAARRAIITLARPRRSSPASSPRFPPLSFRRADSSHFTIPLLIFDGV